MGARSPRLKLRRIACAGLALSMTIEDAQFALRLGMTAVHDLLSNMLGAACLLRITRKREERG